MDFEKYKIKFNVAGARLFEKITGKSFYEWNIEDTPKMVYCCLVANNDLNITFDAFKNMLENSRISNWITNEFEKILLFMGQIERKHAESGSTSASTAETKYTLSAIASRLIIFYGMDAHYVNYEMPLYEIEDYVKMSDEWEKDQMETKRLFSWLGNMSNFKKKISVENYLPFPWEKEAKKNNAEENLKKNQQAILNTFRKMNGEKGNRDINNIT